MLCQINSPSANIIFSMAIFEHPAQPKIISQPPPLPNFKFSLKDLWLILFAITASFGVGIFIKGEVLFGVILAASSLLGILARLFAHDDENFAKYEDFILLTCIVTIVSLTDGIDSLFIFSIYFFPLTRNLNSKINSSSTLALLTSILLVTLSYLIPVLHQGLLDFPFRHILIFTGPILVGFFADTLLNKLNFSEQQKNQAFLIAKISAGEKAQLEAILQSMQVGLITTDLKGEIIFASQKTLEILNSNLPALQNSHINTFLLTHNLYGKMLSDTQIDLTPFAKKRAIVKINSFPLISEAEVKGTIYLMYDVTKEKQLEEMKLDFVTMAAHQLRTPLTTIKSYLAVLADSLENKLTEEEKLYLNRSMISTNELGALIENLLNISRIEEGRLKLQLKPASLESILQSIVERLSVYADQNKVTLSLEKSPNPLPNVMVDPFLITQVLNNIITNAIQYSPQNDKVIITTEDQKDYLVVHVRDFGKGIPKEAIPQLFTKFYKVAGGLTQDVKGIGLGLYISKAIIDAHHGKIWADGGNGLGATFSFSLPIAPKESINYKNFKNLPHL